MLKRARPSHPAYAWSGGLALLLFWSASALPASAQAPVAMVRARTGAVTFRHGSGNWMDLRPMQGLAAGDSIRCGPGAKATVILFQGGKLVNVGPGEAKVEPTALVGSNVMAGGNVRIPASTGSAGNTGRTGGFNDIGGRIGGYRTEGFRLVSRTDQSPSRLNPDSPGWVIGTRPVFRWLSPSKDATSWTFTLFDSNDNVVWSTRTSDRQEIQPGIVIGVASFPEEEEVHPLLEERPYTWMVTAFSQEGNPLPNGRRWGIITPLSQEQADQLQAAVRETFGDLANQGNLRDAAVQTQLKNDPSYASSLLTLAFVYRSYGVLQRTIEILQALPDPAAAEALQSVYQEISQFGRQLAGVNTPAP